MDPTPKNNPNEVPEPQAAPVPASAQPVEPTPSVEPAAESTPAPTPSLPTEPPVSSTTPSEPLASPTPETTPESPANPPEPMVTGDAVPVPTSTPTPEPVSVIAPEPAAVVSGGVVTAVSSGKTPGRRWLVPAVAVAVAVVLLVGGYVFGFYLPNRPEAVFNKSLDKTATAADTLVTYAREQGAQEAQGSSFEGTMKYKGSDMSAEATVKGVVDANANAKMTVDANIMGQKATVEMRSVQVKGNDNPDLYFQFNGVKQYLAAAGLENLSGLEGKWIAVDHTLLDTYTSGVKAEDAAEATLSPTAEQVADAVAKVQAVNKEYLFSTEPDKAVLTYESFVGKETKDGRTLYHYKTGYSQANLQAYITALGKALDASKLNAWSKQASGEDLSQTLDLKAVNDGVKAAKADYIFDLWVDKGTSLVQSVQFADPSDPSSKMTLSQGYTGGDEYPFSVSTATKDMTSTLAVTLDANSDKVKVDVTSASTEKTGGTFTASFTLAPQKDTVQVTAPASSTPFMEVITMLGLFGGTDLPITPVMPTEMGSSESSSFTFTQ
jgi:hypothetical protein